MTKKEFLHFLNLQNLSLSNRCSLVLYQGHSLVAGFFPFCRGEVSVFYIHCQLVLFFSNVQDFHIFQWGTNHIVVFNRCVYASLFDRVLSSSLNVCCLASGVCLLLHCSVCSNRPGRTPTGTLSTLLYLTITRLTIDSGMIKFDAIFSLNDSTFIMDNSARKSLEASQFCGTSSSRDSGVAGDDLCYVELYFTKWDK